MPGRLEAVSERSLRTSHGRRTIARSGIAEACPWIHSYLAGFRAQTRRSPALGRRLSGFGSTIIDARESYRYNSDTELCSRDARAALRGGGTEYGP